MLPVEVFFEHNIEAIEEVSPTGGAPGDNSSLRPHLNILYKLPGQRIAWRERGLRITIFNGIQWSARIKNSRGEGVE